MSKAVFFQKKWWEFLVAMTERELKVGYKNTLLGFGWIVINPILQMVVFGLLFGVILNFKDDHYFLFLISGLVLWNYFSYTINKSVPIILNRRCLIHKADFPREVLVLSVVFSNLIHLLLSVFFVLFISTFTFGFGAFSGYWILLIALLWLLVLTIGMSLFLSALNVRHRDISFIVNIIMPLWLYATPVVYDLRILPQSFAKWMYLNPLTGVVELFRYAVMSVPPFDFNLCLVSSLISLSLLVVGVFFFKKNDPWFDDWV